MAGLASFLGFGKKQKPQTTAAVSAPGPLDAPQGQSLNQLASQRINAGTTGAETPGVGFGPDFLNKATNPAIANIDYNFQNRTLPQLNSELSKRGVARSAGAGLATDVIGRADQQRNLDVNNLMSQFYTLNEQQKKTDITQGINVGQNLNNQYLQNTEFNAGQLNQMNNANATRNFQYQQTQNQNDLNRQNQVGSAAGQGLSMLGGTQSVQDLLKSMGLQQAGGASGVQTNMLGNQPGVGQTSTYGPNNIPSGFEAQSNPGGGVNTSGGGIDWGQIAQVALPALLALL